jgi:hypothetical protein
VVIPFSVCAFVCVSERECVCVYLSHIPCTLRRVFVCVCVCVCVCLCVYSVMCAILMLQLYLPYYIPTQSLSHPSRTPSQTCLH